MIYYDRKREIAMEINTKSEIRLEFVMKTKNQVIAQQVTCHVTRFNKNWIDTGPHFNEMVS
jgi:catabolite regulation protein CreA